MDVGSIIVGGGGGGEGGLCIEVNVCTPPNHSCR